MTVSRTFDQLERIRDRMFLGERFGCEEVSSWMDCSDIEYRGAAHDILMSKSGLLEGEIDRDKAEVFLVQYLLDCMREAGKPSQPRIFQMPAHVAAHTLALLYRKWAECVPPSVHALERIRLELKQIYLEGNEKQRGCVVNGVLEHVFETAECRKDFDEWLAEPALAPAIHLASEWADNQDRA